MGMKAGVAGGNSGRGGEGEGSGWSADKIVERREGGA